MRVPGILLALLFGLASLGAAPASGQSQAAPSSVAPSDLRNSAAEASPIGKFHSANERLHNFDLRNLGSVHIEEDRDNVCYTMRSYIVARENRNSDSTMLVGYSTCQPSSKYELRITVEDPKECLALLAGCSVALQASPPSAPAVPAPPRASENIGTTTPPRVSPSVPMPPRIVLQLPRFPKLQPELQPVLPMFAAPDSDGAIPPRIVLQMPRFPKLQSELQPVLPMLAAPDSHAPKPLHVPFIRWQMSPP